MGLHPLPASLATVTASRLAIRKYAEGRALEIPDLRGFWDERNNSPPKTASEQRRTRMEDVAASSRRITRDGMETPSTTLRAETRLWWPCG